jgi:hypothetical protein
MKSLRENGCDDVEEGTGESTARIPRFPKRLKT